MECFKISNIISKLIFVQNMFFVDIFSEGFRGVILLSVTIISANRILP